MTWFLRITCDRCGKDRMISESHFDRRDMRIGDIIKRARHDGCGGRAGTAELLTGIEGASSRPIRKAAPRLQLSMQSVTGKCVDSSM
jgi:hypothetical protein